jgi:cytosine/adenosine deaminase-related metal-dependent hydrolase
MRKISADYIYPISSDPIANGVVIVDEKGVILNVCKQEDISDKQDVEYYKGIICPGFINTHCHLELSHLRAQISEKTGITDFVKEIISKRNLFSEDQIQQAIVYAEAEMIKNGIVAVGDISNNNSTFKQKAKRNLYYHTFVEAFDLNPERATEVFETALSLREQLLTLDFKLSNSITPHAPYTVSDTLFELIYKESVRNNALLSIHNQESEAENELFISKSGKIHESFTGMGINMDFIKHTGVSSLQSYFRKLEPNSKKLFVHNTYTSAKDVQFADANELKTPNSNHKTIYWCTCPNANMYIENRLPDYNVFLENNALVTIGTDSLASNWGLSILDELKMIHTHYPKISLNTLLTWATKNGADFLGLDYLGSIEKGKAPGLILLDNIQDTNITSQSSVKRLI